jgi:integrase
MWIKRFILFHNKRHPASMGGEEVNAFLTSLAVDDHVSASTQNQALSALLFLYREVLQDPLPWMDELIRANRPVRLPVVLTPDEVRGVIQRMPASVTTAFSRTARALIASIWPIG